MLYNILSTVWYIWCMSLVTTVFVSLYNSSYINLFLVIATLILILLHYVLVINITLIGNSKF